MDRTATDFILNYIACVFGCSEFLKLRTDQFHAETGGFMLKTVILISRINNLRELPAGGGCLHSFLNDSARSQVEETEC